MGQYILHPEGTITQGTSRSAFALGAAANPLNKGGILDISARIFFFFFSMRNWFRKFVVSPCVFLSASLSNFKQSAHYFSSPVSLLEQSSTGLLAHSAL